MAKNLSEKQKAFADYYIECSNATEAAKKAGYSAKTAGVIGAENLKKPNISEYIQKRLEIIDSNRIATLKEVQEIRTKILRGEHKDDFGFAPSADEMLKAAKDLEKALIIKEEQKEKKRAEEEARKAKTYHLDLDIIPDSFHAVIRDIRNHKHLEYVFEGGRGSTKSSTVANVIPELMKNHHEVHAVICRKVGVTLKDSVYSKIKWALGKQEIEEQFDAKLSPLEITLKATGQKIYFRGADEPEKIKSISPPFGYIAILWFEELDQFNGEEEIRNIEQSAIRGGDIAWIFKTFNPPKTANNWANEYVKEPKENRVVHHSTYKDVPEEWLGKPFIEEAEHIRKTNPEAYEHEYEGIANGNGGMVFEYLRFETITDEQIKSFDRIYQGVDWGFFPDPYAFVRLHYDKARETIYFIDELYIQKKQNAFTAKWILNKGYDDYEITCDSQEKKSVADYRDFGIPARAAVKGPGSVEYGMKWLQTKTLVIDKERTPNVYKEFKNYEYERDKEGKPISGYPDADNHAIDATRYALEKHYNKRGNSA